MSHYVGYLLSCFVRGNNHFQNVKMDFMQIVFFIVVVCAAVEAQHPEVPHYPDSYSTKGVIRIVGSEIVEPFSHSINDEEHLATTYYYGGTMATFNYWGHRGWLLAYVSDEKEMNQRKCLEGTQELVHTIPDLTINNFTYAKTENIDIGFGPIKCNKFVFSMTPMPGKGFGKVLRYIFWAAYSDNRPVRFKEVGMDLLTESYFDVHIVDYHNYTTEVVNKVQFDEILKKYNCTDLEKNDDHERSELEVNPFIEIVGGEKSHLDASFDEFKNKHGKKYENETSENDRKEIFQRNLRYIHSMNRAGKSYRLAVNHLADQTEEELSLRFGYRPSKDKSMLPNHTAEEVFGEWKDKELPESLDYRMLGAVTPIKDQALCGSCWTFGATGALEGAYALKYGERLTFSEQELIDCSWGFGYNYGCNGGLSIDALKYVKKHGLATNYDYGTGNYLGIDGKCVRDQAKRSVRVKDVGKVPHSADALKRALLAKGPLAVGIVAFTRSLWFYSSGVYHDPNCHGTINHAVTAVGFGKMNGREYFIIKNEWSSYWGMDGYILLDAKGNECMVEDQAVWAEVEKPNAD